MKCLCPDCGAPAALNRDLTSCIQCGRRFRNAAGILDFVDSPDRANERRFYDDAYVNAQRNQAKRQSIDSVLPLWYLPQSPENRIILEKVGKLAGKTVLLLGNGESVKELHFLKMNPAHLVYSDLSSFAFVNIYERFNLEDFLDQLTFAAIDAEDLPFSDETFDVIYGYAMVHHLPNLDRFFDSAIKALKPGGYAVFMDDAFAPIWHYSKQTWLKPLMKFSQNKSGISPEDYRFSMSGGFREEELASKVRRAGGEPWFVRTALFSYLVFRGSEKLLPKRLSRMLRTPRAANAIRTLDNWMCRLPLLRRNQIRLIWGFAKPS